MSLNTHEVYERALACTICLNGTWNFNTRLNSTAPKFAVSESPMATLTAGRSDRLVDTGDWS